MAINKCLSGHEKENITYDESSSAKPSRQSSDEVLHALNSMKFLLRKLVFKNFIYLPEAIGLSAVVMLVSQEVFDRGRHRDRVIIIGELCHLLVLRPKWLLAWLSSEVRK